MKMSVCCSKRPDHRQPSRAPFELLGNRLPTNLTRTAFVRALARRSSSIDEVQRELLKGTLIASSLTTLLKRTCMTKPGVAVASRRGENLSKLNWYMRACALFLLWATTTVSLPAQTFKTVHSFASRDGAFPWASLVQATDGNFYGTTQIGGNAACPSGCGTVFKVTPSGKLTIFSFDGTNGSTPFAGLVQGADGDLYGATLGGGTGTNPPRGPRGTVFTITPNGTCTVLHAFDNMDGSLPFAGLIRGANGDFYGTTEEGGAYAYGTVFVITSTGSLTTLHSFDVTDGDTPISPLVQANDGNYYGTTSYDGTHPNFGTVYKITPSGKLTTLYNFDSKDGSYPYAGLVQATNGAFYGATFAGGSSKACPYGCGTVFSLSVGLRPFIETVPTSGKAGAIITILGTNLTGATSVSFHGTAAEFMVISQSEIRTNVPSGATSGTVEVTTPEETFKSNVVFPVTD